MSNNTITKTTKKKMIFFGGEFLEIDDDLKSNIQEILDKALPNGFLVDSVMITNNEVTVKIFRFPKDFYTTDPDYTNLDDAVILNGDLEKAKVFIPLGPMPYSNYVHYSIYIPDILNGYNDLMKQQGYKKLKDLVINSTKTYVVYHFRFK